MLRYSKKFWVISLIIIISCLPLIPELQTTIDGAIKSSSIQETEDFSNEAHGTTGLDIDFIDEYHGYGSWYYCDQYIADGPYGNHYKVLIMRDAQGAKNTWSVHYLDNSYEVGTIEFSLWLNSGGSCTNPHYHYIKFRDSSDTIAFQLQFDLYSNKAYYHTGSEWALIATLTKAEWYRYSIDFNKDAAKFNIEIVKETTSTVVGIITNAEYQNNVPIEEVYLGTTYYHYSGNTRWDNFLFVESSDSITIFTPETFMYEDYINGYYPATFGFENEDEGASGTAIAFVDYADIDSNCEGKVYDEYEDHKKVLRLRDGNQLGTAEVVNYFDSTQTNSFIEWWWLIPNSGSNTILFNLHEDNTDRIAVSLKAIDESFVDSNGTLVFPYTEDRWYHHKIVFNCITDSYDWYINTLKVVENSNFLNDVGNVGALKIKGTQEGTGDSYFDAIGYKWHPAYNHIDNPCDNRKEGLLIDFEPDDLEWMEYIYYGLEPIETYGDFVIPLVSMWSNTIHIFGEDAQGNSYSSEIKAFYRNQLVVSSPENQEVYTEPMEGYYPASYGFENDEDGENPDGWIVTEPTGCGFVEVDPSLDGHQKVVEVRKNGGKSKVSIEKQFVQNPTKGTVEYWLYKDTDSGIDGTIMYLLGDVGSAYFLIEDGNLYRGPYPNKVLIASDVFSANTWHHFRIDFDISHGYQIYLDDVLYGRDYSLPFEGSPAYIRSFVLRSHWSGCRADYGAWLDAFSYSWDPYYDIRDNKREGILLNIDPSKWLYPTTTLQSLSLSYDGNYSRNLSGNIVLPFYDGGNHYIYVTAESTEGALYMSDVIQYSNEPEGWYPTTLIGSSERFFPHEDIARLGFTINTLDFLRNDPKISICINETSSYSNLISITLLIDNEIIWTTESDIGSDTIYNIFKVNKLRLFGTHQIIVELASTWTPNDIYRLEYIEIGHLQFEQSRVYPEFDNSRFVPFQMYQYFEACYDEAQISIGFKVPFDNDLHKIAGSNWPTFRTEIGIWINPDRDEVENILLSRYYYIDSIQFQWKIIDPDGNFVDSSQLGSNSYIGINWNGDTPFGELIWMFDEWKLSWIFGSIFLPPYFTVPINILLAFLDYSVHPTPPGTGQGEVGEFEYETHWSAGRVDLGPWGVKPLPCLAEATMLVQWAPMLTSQHFGCYQIQLKWNIEIMRHEIIRNPFGEDSHDILEGFSLNNYDSIYYVNFEYVKLN